MSTHCKSMVPGNDLTLVMYRLIAVINRSQYVHCTLSGPLELLSHLNKSLSPLSVIRVPLQSSSIHASLYEVFSKVVTECQSFSSTESSKSTIDMYNMYMYMQYKVCGPGTFSQCNWKYHLWSQNHSNERCWANKYGTIPDVLCLHFHFFWSNRWMLRLKSNFSGIHVHLHRIR